MSRRVRVHFLAWPLLLTVATSSRGIAQTNLATIVGIVRDTAGAPLGLAQISLQGIRGTSDSAGRFALGGLTPGTATLHVRRIGFEPRDTSLELVGGRTDSLVVALAMLAASLPGVTTEADALMQLRLSDFYRHRQGGMGYYFDRKELESLRVNRISDVLRRIPGIRLIPDRSGRYQVRMGRTGGGRACPPDFWIDGVRAPFLNVDDLPLADVEALEVYKGFPGLPPEFTHRFGNPECGAVVIWTRVPG